MALNRVLLGDLIELTDETNSLNNYGPDDVRGMTITKEIIPTKADVDNAALDKFLVIKPGEFVYNPRTHGKKIGLGFNNSDKAFIISWNNTGFRVKDDKSNEVVPAYLFMQFNRAEWDREACFHSWGSSTEVFSWKEFCGMSIDLPDIEIQRKYVAIYRAMQENQRSYEKGLDDLNLVSQAFVERLKDRYPLKEIGPYIEQKDLRNNIGLSADRVRGISTDKKLISTKADLNGVSLKSYKIVHHRQIAYVPDTSRRGDKISLGMNTEDKDVLVSSIYTVMETHESRLLPDYLMLFFSRFAFDRYARFHSWGTARETFDWNEMCKVKIPIPDIDTQKSIVNIYKTYLKRYELNERLKANLKNICPMLIRGAVTDAMANS